MEYYIFAYTKKEGCPPETENRLTRRSNCKTFYVALQSRDQNKRRPVLHKTDAYYTFDCTYEEKYKIFEDYILERFGIISWEEHTNNLQQEIAIQYSEQLSDYFNQVSSIQTVSIHKDKNKQVIYLLKKDGVVVYVGQSKGVKRPFEHTDKDWDSVDYLFIPMHYDLNVIERFYIDYYKPKYNKGMPVSTSIMRKVYNILKQSKKS